MYSLWGQLYTENPELKEYRRGGTRQNNVLLVWAAFSYFEMGIICMLYSREQRAKRLLAVIWRLPRCKLPHSLPRGL